MASSHPPRHGRRRSPSPEAFTPKQWEAVDLSDSHMMLLYLISKYSESDQVDGSGDRWVRGIPLLVLMYEMIVDQVRSASGPRHRSVAPASPWQAPG